MNKAAAAPLVPMRQRSQYTCMATSLAMCLKANGLDTDEDEVNRVMGAKPMQGASWEQAFAAAQHFGMRTTMIIPATLSQVKAWTDKGIPVMIAWNPEGRPWSHASVVFDVTDDGFVHVADPNIPDPEQTVRIVSKDDFYHKWFEKWPDYLVRRPAVAVEREITPDGKQRVASQRVAKKESIRDVQKRLDADGTEEKDKQRIKDMSSKADGDDPKANAEKMLSLARNMAKSITSYEKAYRRFLAAEGYNYHDVAEVFLNRFTELFKAGKQGSEDVTASSTSALSRVEKYPFPEGAVHQPGMFDDQWMKAFLDKDGILWRVEYDRGSGKPVEVVLLSSTKKPLFRLDVESSGFPTFGTYGKNRGPLPKGFTEASRLTPPQQGHVKKSLLKFLDRKGYAYHGSAWESYGPFNEREAVEIVKFVEREVEKVQTVAKLAAGMITPDFVETWTKALTKAAEGRDFQDPEDRAAFRQAVLMATKNLKVEGIIGLISEWGGITFPKNTGRLEVAKYLANLWMKDHPKSTGKSAGFWDSRPDVTREEGDLAKTVKDMIEVAHHLKDTREYTFLLTIERGLRTLPKGAKNELSMSPRQEKWFSALRSQYQPYLASGALAALRRSVEFDELLKDWTLGTKDEQSYYRKAVGSKTALLRMAVPGMSGFEVYVRFAPSDPWRTYSFRDLPSAAKAAELVLHANKVPASWNAVAKKPSIRASQPLSTRPDYGSRDPEKTREAALAARWLAGR